jgi:hypothetical protein
VAEIRDAIAVIVVALDAIAFVAAVAVRGGGRLDCTSLCQNSTRLRLSVAGALKLRHGGTTAFVWFDGNYESLFPGDEV